MSRPTSADDFRIAGNARDDGLFFRHPEFESGDVGFQHGFELVGQAIGGGPIRRNGADRGPRSTTGRRPRVAKSKAAGERTGWCPSVTAGDSCVLDYSRFLQIAPFMIGDDAYRECCAWRVAHSPPGRLSGRCAGGLHPFCDGSGNQINRGSADWLSAASGSDTPQPAGPGLVASLSAGGYLHTSGADRLWFSDEPIRWRNGMFPWPR